MWSSSGSRRWRASGVDLLLFAGLGLAPAAVLTWLGVRAAGSADEAARKEVASLVRAGAAGLSLELERGLDLAEARLASAAPAELGAPGLCPRFAEAVVVPPARAHAEAPTNTALEAACRAARGAAQLVERCELARDASGRWLLPVLFFREPAGAAGSLDALAGWLERHGAELSSVEAAALRDEVASLPASELGGSRLAAAVARLGAPSVGEALARREGGRGATPRYVGTSSLGVLRERADGARVGCVVHAASVRAALLGPAAAGTQGSSRAGPAGVEPLAGLGALRSDAFAALGESGLRARVVREGEGGPEPSALARLTPELVIRVEPARADDVARRARRTRLIIFGTLGAACAVVLSLGLWVLRRARKALEASELRTDFVAAVSHELRTPLASARMLAELLEKGLVEGDDERREVTSALASEVRRLGVTTERLLRFRRLMAEGRPPRPPVIDVGALVAEVAESWASAEVDLRVRSPEGRHHARVEPDELRLALENLLHNAKKHAPEGGPYEVSTRGEGRLVVVTVRDHGPGIAAQHRERVFEPFERLADRLSEATEGFGIGLAMVRAVARRHGGDATVREAEGGGAAFELTFPSAPSERSDRSDRADRTDRSDRSDRSDHAADPPDGSPPSAQAATIEP